MSDDYEGITVCPECEARFSIREVWAEGRKVQKLCGECGWRGAPRTPNTLPIENWRTIDVHHSGCLVFYVFDKYGYLIHISKGYYSEDEAVKDLTKELERGRTDEIAGPYTATMYPRTVRVEAKVYK